MSGTRRVRWLMAAVLCALLCAGVLLQQSFAQDFVTGEDFSIVARGAAVLEASTGRLLFAQNETAQLSMASTTKIMTALIALEQPGLDEEFVVDSQAILVEGTSMGLQPGDIVTLRTLAYGMLLQSGNDAANAAAVRIGGSIEDFAALMNRRASELKLYNTHFMNPSGLTADGHYSSAEDMARLAQAALQNPDFADICATESIQVSYGNPPYARWLSNHNKLLELYEGTIGVKTGYTEAAGRCLVSAAKRDGITLICVTLGAADDWNVHMSLFDRYFGLLTLQAAPGAPTDLSVPVVGSDEGRVHILPSRPVELPLADSEYYRLSYETLLEPFVYAPVAEGQKVGELRIFVDGRPMESIDLVAERQIPANFDIRDQLYIWDNWF